jgi:hypothetical protein
VDDLGNDNLYLDTNIKEEKIMEQERNKAPKMEMIKEKSLIH